MPRWLLKGLIGPYSSLPAPLWSTIDRLPLGAAPVVRRVISFLGPTDAFLELVQLGGVLVYGFRDGSISIKDSHEVINPHDHSVDPSNGSVASP